MFKIKRLLFFVILLLLTSCSKEPVHNKVLENAISTELKTEGTTEIQLGQYIDFSWDKAFIFTPYTSNETIQEQLEKNDIDSNFDSRIEYLDSFNLIIFVNEGEVVQYAEVPTKDGDIIVEKKNWYTPENDRISVRLHKD